MEYQSPLGSLTLGSDGENIVGLWLAGQKYFGGTVFGEMEQNNALPAFCKAKSWLDSYFAGERPLLSDLPLRPLGGIFRRRVWKILCKIPYGEVATYGGIAKEIAEHTGRPMSARAVGGAVGHNPISIIIPCHRVVGTNGSLTGYSGGITAKIWLLRHEGADMSRLFVPNQETVL